MSTGIMQPIAGESSKKRTCYFFDSDIGNYHYGPSHPMKPHRIRMAHSLIMNFGLYKKMEIFRAKPATKKEMAQFHTDEYVDFLSRVTPDLVEAAAEGSGGGRANGIAREMGKFNVGDDCPVFDGLFEYCSISAGGSMEGAARLSRDKCDIAINWAGGLHHAKKAEASGFCYINDIVLGILELLRYHPRVLYVDIDVHHGDGVEEAFYTTDRVMTASFHKYGEFFPGTGDLKDIGYGKGRNYSVNVPLRDGITDEAYKNVFEPVISSIMEHYRPSAVVLQCGGDSLSGDRLGTFNLSMRGHANCVQFIKSFGLPLLLLGGGGYTIRNVSRTWAFETGLAAGQELGANIPMNEYYEYFGPTYRLDVPPSNMDDQNTREYLEKVKMQVFENLRHTGVAPTIPRTAMDEDDDVDEDERDPNDRRSRNVLDSRIQRDDEFSDSEDEGEGGPDSPDPASNPSAAPVRRETVSTNVRRFSMDQGTAGRGEDSKKEEQKKKEKPTEERGTSASTTSTAPPRTRSGPQSAPAPAPPVARPATQPPKPPSLPTATFPPTLPSAAPKSKAIPLKTFKPGRVAPPPPSATPSSSQPAKPVVVPANVGAVAGKTKLSIEIPKKEGKIAPKKVEAVKTTEKRSVEAELPRVKEVKRLEEWKVEEVEEQPVDRQPAPSTLPSTVKPAPMPPSDIRAPSTSLPTPLPDVARPSPPVPIPTSPFSLASQPAISPTDEKRSSYFSDTPSYPPPPSSVSTSPLSPPRTTSLAFLTPSSPPQHPPLSRHHPSQSTSRPLLTRSRSSADTTLNLPAANVFDSGSDPLVLPALDLYLDSLPPVKFSDPEKIMSVEEMVRWKKWLAVEKEGWWARTWKNLTGSGRQSTAYADLEKSNAGAEAKEESKRLIFPSMDLIPTDLTLSELKRNQLKPLPIESLQSALKSTVNGILGLEGSSFAISLFTVESFRDLMQLITLLTTSATRQADLNTTATWYRVIFVDIPSVFALDFVSAFGKAILWLWVFTLIAAVGCYEVWRFTGGRAFQHLDVGEGLDQEDAVRRKEKVSWRDSKAYMTGVTFLLTSLYLPLSKISIGALVWSSDYWALSDNPYATSDNPDPAPLGPSSEFYDTLDFCYKTTMKRPSGLKNFNWAYIILPIAASTCIWLTLWLPWRLYRTVQRAAPRVDKYTELGELRKDTTAEYERLLDQDKSPFSFLYQDYRRRWAGFKSIYMGIKLVNVLLIVVLSKDNWFSRANLDYLSNNSDRVSRVCYVVIALIGLLVALNVQGSAALGGGVNMISYASSVYRLLKKAQFRLDFSIDLFSPHLDLTKHLSRRIWQETISTILVAGPEFKMPRKEQLRFTDNPALPPQLLGFQGTQAERHVENLKILRELGLEVYDEALKARALSPDSRAMQDPAHPVYFSDVDDLELLIEQNESDDVVSRRRVRIALRALEGQPIFAPHTEMKNGGGGHGASAGNRIDYRTGVLRIDRNSAVTWRGYNYSSGFRVHITYSDGQGQDGAGQVHRCQKLTLDGSALGLTTDFGLTPRLAKLFRHNREMLEARIFHIENILCSHREYFQALAEWKHRTLSHSFLFNVVAEDQLSRKQLEHVLQSTEEDPRVREMASTWRASIELACERMKSTGKSRVHSWWFIFWDDCWRHNHATVSAMNKRPAAFSPHYRTSLCYTPMSRPKLEAFLRENGCWTYGGKHGFFNSGMLNMIYFYLDEITFAATQFAVPVHLGSSSAKVPFADLTHDPRRHLKDISTNDVEGYGSRISRGTFDTGGGTDENDDKIYQRADFPWRDVYRSPRALWAPGYRWEWTKDFAKKQFHSLGVWFGIYPHRYEVHPLGKGGYMSLDLRKGKDGWELPRRG
ncbi:hypothetical protein MNV49_002116 [Pseudohyphozyma bogoriensis]|nr:hypothetical protein MNV49_002116 [Pseudohyphozyma bogoriensis]